MYKPGAIRKIQVENFVTYSYAEMYPGPNLNLLIGPNGTGKSTMVASIILGLGGNPKTVGRGTRVSEYIKHGCNEATINIYLQGEGVDELIKVSREFGADEKSIWKMNDKKVTQQNFKEFVRKFDIQVDNLCQFLPQDRVQEFARLNKQELLKETQVALCRLDLVEKQDDLINGRNRHKKLVQNLQKWEDSLADANEVRLRLEGKMQNFQKRKEYQEKIKNIDRKVAWILYDVLKVRLEEVKEVRKREHAELEQKRKDIEPMQGAVNNAKRMIEEMQGKITNLNHQLRQALHTVSKDLEDSESFKQSIRRLEREMDGLLGELAQQAAEIQAVEVDLEKVEGEKATLLESFNAEQIEQKLERYRHESRKLQQHIRTLEETIGELTDRKRNKIMEVRSLQNELSRLENAKQQRLEKLKMIDPDAHAMVMWLRANRHVFKGEIFEPMMLEINVLNPQHSFYLENVIARRDKVAFTCTDKADTPLFIKVLRQNRWNCNVFHSSYGGVEDYVPAMPIEQLRRYGFYAYLKSLFTAPEPIMKYLCKMYRVHQIPVGTEVTNSMYNQVPKNISVFFSVDSRFTVTSSKYTGQKSIRQGSINSDGTLSVSIDTLKIEQARGQINEVQTACDRYQNQIDDLHTQIAQVNEKITQFKQKAATVESKRRDFQSLQNRTRILQNKLNDLRQNNQTEEEIRAHTKTQIQNVVKGLINAQNTIQNHYKILLDKLKKRKLQNLRLILARKEVDYLTTSYREKQRDVQKAEEALDRLRLLYNDIKTKENEGLQRALSLSNNCKRNQPGFDEFRQSYDELSVNVEALEAEKVDLQSRIDCLQAANAGEIEEYEQTEARVEKLERDIEQGRSDLDNLLELLNSSQEQWLDPLEEIVGQINQKFGEAFERMGCAGEVTICKGPDERDYADYGLSIKVSYRDGEPLQELNATVQSGGERAVATAAFMLSLQELTPVPFRCVDEINQGMDAPNERRIFDLLVESTSKPNTSQYFLITPKLVPGLKFVSTMKVHIVHNGLFLAPAEEWSKMRLCNSEGL